MSEWKELKIEDFCEVIGGGTPSTKEDSYYGGDISWITPRDLTNYKNRFISRGERNISDLGLKNSSAKILPKNSILLTSRAPIGYLAIAENEVCTNQGFKSLIVDAAKADYNFVYYLIKSNVERIKGLGTGTTFAEISGSVVKGLKFTIPNLPTQTAIAEILSSLDDKIELNNKINQELETLAQTLFKQWFIDFEFPNENGEPYKSSGGEMVESELGEIPNGWEVGSIYDISSVIYGAPFKSSLFNQERKGYPLIRIRDLKTFKPQNWTEEVLSKGTKIQPGDLVVGMDAEFRPHFWLGEEGWLNQRVCLFKPKSEFSRLFVREIIRPLLAFYENSLVGTTVIHLGKGDIDTFKSIIPSNHLSKLFTELSEPLINKIIENSRENESLRNLRDTLLPKLISGELEINELPN